MEDRDKLILARYVVGGILRTEHLVNYADYKLSCGLYSDHLLNIVDEEPKIWEPVSNYFEKAIDEFGFEFPTFENAIWYITRFYVCLISERKLNALNVFNSLLSEVDGRWLWKRNKKYHGDYLGIHEMMSFRDRHGDGPYYLSREEVDNGIYEKSLEWILKYGKSF